MRNVFIACFLALVFNVSFAADVKISALPAGAALGGSEELPAVQSATTVKTTPSAFATYLAPLSQTLTNKTISGASNTLSNIGNASLTNSAITINGTSVSLGGTRTLSLASSDFVNQGTTTTVLHGNAAGNPSFSAVSLSADVTGTLADGSLSANVPLLNASNTWTGTTNTLSSAEPRLLLNETDQASNEKLWDWDIQAKTLTLRTRTDADGAGVNALSIVRGTGTALASLSFGNATNNPTYTFLGTGTTTYSGAVTTGTSGFSGGRFIASSGGSVPSNGMYLAGTNRLGFSTNSTQAGEFDASRNFVITTVGAGLQVKEGSNAKMGTCTLVAGACTVSTTAVTANSRVFLTAQALGTVTVGQGLAVSARTAGTSFTITSGAPTDTSTVAWLLIEPSP